MPSDVVMSTGNSHASGCQNFLKHFITVEQVTTNLQCGKSQATCNVLAMNPSLKTRMSIRRRWKMKGGRRGHEENEGRKMTGGS